MLKQGRVLVSLPGNSSGHTIVKASEISFFLFFYAKPSNLSKRDLDNPAQDATRDLTSS